LVRMARTVTGVAPGDIPEARPVGGSYARLYTRRGQQNPGHVLMAPAIDGGSYASGEATISLKKGQPVTLVKTADSSRYRLVLL
jgi:hypothetical protein